MAKQHNKDTLGLKTSNYTDKTLTVLSKKISDYFLDREISDLIDEFCLGNNLSKTLNRYPYTGVETFFKSVRLGYSREKSDTIINNFIESILHPLNFGANEYRLEIFVAEVNKIIKYDRYTIQEYGNNDYAILTESEYESMQSENAEHTEILMKQYDEEKKFEEKKIIENRDLFLNIRKYYITLIDLVRIFLKNPNALNDSMDESYVFLKKEICKLFKRVDFIRDYLMSKNNCYFPFTTDLLSAEMEWKRREKGILSWNTVRPLMLEQLSKINKFIGMSDQLIEPEDSEQILRKIQDKVTNYELRNYELSKKNIVADNKNINNSENTFEVFIHDREVRVNNYLIAKPHAVGKNLDFFQYVFNNSDKELEISDTPTMGKGPLKILNDIGFTGELLKAFFPKRSNKKTILFRKKVSGDDLKKSDINTTVMKKQLELLDSKNNPK